MKKKKNENRNENNHMIDLSSNLIRLERKRITNK